MASIVTLNSVQIFPSDISVKETKIGKVQISARGDRTFLHRATSGGVPIFKSSWDLSFDGITEARRATLRTLSRITTTMTFVNELGVSYVVQTEEDSYSAGIAVIGAPNALTLYYNVKLQLFEA